jgi:hypothetical protein
LRREGAAVLLTPLPLVEKTCGLYIEEMLPAAISRKLSHSQMVGFCTLYRRMGVAKLFLSGLPDEFFADLCRSARAFLYFLEAKDDSAKLTSMSEPFFDAVACGDKGAVQKIARFSRTTWNAGEEYEDDFLYVWFLMSRFALDAPSPELTAILSRWERVLAGADDPKLDLCRAFSSKDQRLFDSTLAVMASDREQENQKRIQQERMQPDDAPTLAKLWVELLALLRFAEQAGLKTEEHYPLAPSVARRLDLARLPPSDAWRQIRSYREIG